MQEQVADLTPQADGAPSAYSRNVICRQIIIFGRPVSFRDFPPYPISENLPINPQVEISVRLLSRTPDRKKMRKKNGCIYFKSLL
jgi:hypothetical protein